MLAMAGKSTGKLNLIGLILKTIAFSDDLFYVFLSQVHLVHYSSEYSTLLEAADNPGGVAALSFMVEVSPFNIFVVFQI